MDNSEQLYELFKRFMDDTSTDRREQAKIFAESLNDVAREFKATLARANAAHVAAITSLQKDVRIFGMILVLAVVTLAGVNVFADKGIFKILLATN